MEKLNKLISHCKADISLHINAHKSLYQTIEQYFNGYFLKEDLEDIEPEVFNKMVELDRMVELTFYPDTPIGSYKIYHYDVELAIDNALKILKDEKYI